MAQQTQLVAKARERIEKWRARGQTETQRVRERIKKWRAGGASLSGESLISEVREKGLIEALRARREARRTPYKAPTGSVGQKEYKKELALEASTGQLKIQKGRVAIEA